MSRHITWFSMELEPIEGAGFKLGKMISPLSGIFWHTIKPGTREHGTMEQWTMDIVGTTVHPRIPVKHPGILMEHQHYTAEHPWATKPYETKNNCSVSLKKYQPLFNTFHTFNIFKFEISFIADII